MATPIKLTDSEIEAALTVATGWKRSGDRLTRRFEFLDFVTAWTFMSGAALIAERMNHHPEWSNVYRTVRVELSTHDVGGISRLDFELARAMNTIAEPLLATMIATSA